MSQKLSSENHNATHGKKEAKNPFFRHVVIKLCNLFLASDDAVTETIWLRE